MASNNINRVAINTVIQYVQLILNVIIGLFSVRLILNALGASDYGIYDLIAGVVGLLMFISTSLSQTSMRYLSVSLGKHDDNNTSKVFSTCLWLHIYIALILSLLLIACVFFLFNGFLKIEPDRIGVAKALYYFMVFDLFLHITVTPFSALIAAHEKFVYISCVQILDSVLKLVIALILVSCTYDKLLVYGILMVGVTVINFLLYTSYCITRYRKQISLAKASVEEMKDVTGFAGWTLLDVAGTVATRQGYAIMLNSFFGTVVNAVFALSRQVEGHLYTVSASVINTMKPQIMKSQGEGDSERMFRLSLTAGKFGFSMMSLAAIPLLVMMPEILTLWLKNVPEGTVLFTRLMVAACMCEQLTRGLVYANQAVGNIKWFSITISAIRFSALPISWICFKLGSPAYVAIVVFLICEVVGSFSRVVVLSKISDFHPIDFFKSVMLQLIPPFILSLVVALVLYSFISGIWGILLICVVADIVFILVMALIGLTSDEKNAINSIIQSFKKKIGYVR